MINLSDIIVMIKLLVNCQLDIVYLHVHLKLFKSRFHLIEKGFQMYGHLAAVFNAVLSMCLCPHMFTIVWCG